MEVRIRRAGPADGAALLALITAHAAFERAEATIGAEALGHLLDDPAPPCELFVAVRGEAPLGYAAMTLDYALWRGCWWAHLDCLYVDAAHRGQSIGAKLLLAVCDAARTAGADRLEWQTPVWNRRAAAFYRRMGAGQSAKARFTLPIEAARADGRAGV